MSSYAEMLQECGVAFEVDPTLLAHLCRTIKRSSDLCVELDSDVTVIDSDEYVNMIAATDPDVAFVFAEGRMRRASDKKATLLVLPPNADLVTRVRDALWVEGDNASVKRGDKPKRKKEYLAEGARALCLEIQRVYADGGAPLGPRSFRCHQDYVVASMPPGHLFDSAGRLADKDAETHPHGHEAWERLSLRLPSESWLPDMTLSVDVCTDCMATTRATTRLGVMILPPSFKHRHAWTPFSTPAPDAKGEAGMIRGEVCLVESPEIFPGARPGRCMETRGVKYSGRAPVLSAKPDWVRRDRPELRPPAWARSVGIFGEAVKITGGHVHVWDFGRYTFGPGAALPFLRCLTCECELWSNEIHGVSVPSLVEELNRRVKRAGGFSRGSTKDLVAILNEFHDRYNANGELNRFADQLALHGSCDGGLPKVGLPQRQSIWDAERRRESKAVSGETVAWTETHLVISRDGRRRNVAAHVFAKGQENAYLVYKIDGNWEVAHLPSTQCFTARVDSLEKAKTFAEDLQKKGKAPSRRARYAGIEEMRH